MCSCRRKRPIGGWRGPRSGRWWPQRAIVPGCRGSGRMRCGMPLPAGCAPRARRCSRSVRCSVTAIPRRRPCMPRMTATRWRAGSALAGCGMSALASRVDDYLTLRRASGYRLEAHGRLLPQFVSYLDAVGASTVTVEAALAWAVSSTKPGRRGPGCRSCAGSPATCKRSTPPCRCRPPTCCQICAGDQPPICIPSRDHGTAGRAARLQPALRAATYHTLFGLVAATGMRGGEAVKLERDDVDLDAGLLAIRNSKFNKSRRTAAAPLHGHGAGRLPAGACQAVPTTPDAQLLRLSRRDEPQRQRHAHGVPPAGQPGRAAAPVRQIGPRASTI
jgi:hypothetical protein